MGLGSARPAYRPYWDACRVTAILVPKTQAQKCWAHQVIDARMSSDLLVLRLTRRREPMKSSFSMGVSIVYNDSFVTCKLSF